jgi:hypothetical protein
MVMKEYYKRSLGATGYIVNEKFHGLSIVHFDRRFYYLEYKNNTFYYFIISVGKVTIRL